MEMHLIFVNSILPNSVRAVTENSTNYNVKLKNTNFYVDSLFKWLVAHISHILGNKKIISAS